MVAPKKTRSKGAAKPLSITPLAGVIRTGLRSFEYRPTYKAEDGALLERADRFDRALAAIRRFRSSTPRAVDVASDAQELADVLANAAWCLSQPIANDETRETLTSFVRAIVNASRLHDGDAAFVAVFVDRVEAVAAWRTTQDEDACVERLSALLLPVDLSRLETLRETWFGALLGLFRAKTKKRRIELANELMGRAFRLRRASASVETKERARSASRKRNRR